MSAISASERYASDGSSGLWPVTFPYGSPSDLGVTITDNAGHDRDLAYGSGFLVQDGCVMAIVPAGNTITIWLKTSIDAAIAGQRARAASRDGQASRAVQSAAQSGIEHLSDADVVAVEDAVTDGIARIRKEAGEREQLMTARLENSANALQTEIEKDLRELGLEEAGAISRKSALVQNDLARVEALAANVARAGNKANAVLEGSEDAADRSRQSARCAWNAAWQASMLAMRPGIAIVDHICRINHCKGGLFLVEAEFAQRGPTYFMGLWPIKCPCEICWDGFFLTGAKAFPDQPVPPPGPNCNCGDDADDRAPWGPCTFGNCEG